MSLAALGACASSPANPTASESTASDSAPAFPSVSASAAASVLVEDINLGGDTRPGYLVRPENAESDSLAGLVWFHWVEYGSPTSNRTEFLDEAKTMAERGVVSILVDGTFPWLEAPDSIAHDTAALDADLEMLRAAYAALLARPEVDAARTALVGHDFGSMYESAVFAEDSRPLGLAMMTPTARWSDWFAKYWQISDDAADYKTALAPYDPISTLPNAGGRPILLQFATDDQYVSADVADAISAAAGSSAETKRYDTGHELNEAARADRDAWLASLLGLSAE